MCNCRGLVLIFLILLFIFFICLVVFLFPQRDCNFLHFLTDTSAPHRPAELLCSSPSSAGSQHYVILKLHLLPALSSLLCAKEDLRHGFKLTIFRDGPESKDCKNMKALAFCGANEKLCTTLVTSRERGCWTTKTASSNSSWISWSKWVKGRMRLVLGVQLPCSGDRSFNDRE